MITIVQSNVTGIVSLLPLIDIHRFQCVKKVVTDCPGLVDFAIRVLIFCSSLARQASAVF